MVLALVGVWESLVEAMQVKVLLFGPPADQAGRSEVAITLPPGQSTVADLRRLLAAQSPRLAKLLPQCRFAVNHDFAVEDQLIESHDQIAVIGLVCGG